MIHQKQNLVLSLLIFLRLIYISSAMRCAVIGVGVLGSSLCRQLATDPLLKDRIHLVGVTKSDSRHDEIRQIVPSIHLFTNDQVMKDPVHQQAYDHVIFCAPPSGFEDYANAVKQSITLWKGPKNDNTFIFTSSGAVYGKDTSDVVTEATPIEKDSTVERIARLIKAETAVLDANGCVLRLSGLYNLQRGAHNFWITSGKPIAGEPGGLINQVHYDDAASACVAALNSGSKCQGNVFIVSDGNPMTRRQICESALKANIYKDYDMPAFASQDEKPQGKVYDCSKTHQALGWKPAIASFDAYMVANSYERTVVDDE